MDALVVSSPAKINLGLSVGRKRPDGFHDLVTVMVLLELRDTVEICRAASGIEVTADSESVPSGPANLAYQAAEEFFRASHIRPGCRIRIRKRIPVGSGLGGGSSNAATALTGLNRLFDRPLARPRLHRIAVTLGSDVPFFLRDCACVARGRGERLRPIRLPRLDVLLYFPGYPVSTAWAYAALDRARCRPPGLTSFRLSPKILGLSLRQHELNRAAAQVGNDFEPVVFRRHPDLCRVKELLLRHSAFAAALSGSGSTVYGLVEDKGWKDPMAALARHGFHLVKTRTTQPAV